MSKKTDPEPIGFRLEPSHHGRFWAYAIYEGEQIRSAFAIAEGRNQNACWAKAKKALREMHQKWEQRQDGPSGQNVYLYGPKRLPVPPTTPGAVSPPRAPSGMGCR